MREERREAGQAASKQGAEERGHRGNEEERKGRERDRRKAEDRGQEEEEEEEGVRKRKEIAPSGQVLRSRASYDFGVIIG